MCQFSWTSVDTILQVEKIKLWTQIISSSVEECSIKYCTHMLSRHREKHRSLIGVTFTFHDTNDPQFWTSLVGLIFALPSYLALQFSFKLFWIPLGRTHLSFSKSREKPQTHHRFFCPTSLVLFRVLPIKRISTSFTQGVFNIQSARSLILCQPCQLIFATTQTIGPHS